MSGLRDMRSDWTDEQCLQFAAVAFRHAPKNLPDGVTLEDIRLAAQVVLGNASPESGVSWAEEHMALHWIDRYAAGIDEEPQMDRILSCVQVTPEPPGEVVVTRDEDGEIVMVSRQDDEGRILKVIAMTTHAGGKAPAAEDESFRRDAERYRWLRMNANEAWEAETILHLVQAGGHRLDARIDEDMANEADQQHGGES